MHWCLSVSLSRTTLSREWKGVTSWKLVGSKGHRSHEWPVTPNLEVKGSKVSRPLNAVTENQPYLWKGKANELQTWWTDRVQWPASLTCAVTSKVKGQGYNVTSSVWRVSAHNSTKRSRRTAKINRKLSVPRLTFCASSKNKGQGHQTVTGNRSYLWNGMVYELQTWYTYTAQWPASSNCTATS